MTQVLRDGQQLKMNEDAAKKFARDFFLASEDFAVKHANTRSISLGKHSVNLSVNSATPIGALIFDAFIPTESQDPTFTLQVWDSSRGNALPDLAWAREYMQQDIAIPRPSGSALQIAFDKSQGFIYVYNNETKVGSIWIREHSQVALSSFITPFRLMFSWMADHFNGEIIHAATIGIDGKGILINGPSGSGKSTLALLAALRGCQVLADDVTLHHEGKIYGIYSRAKAQASSTPLSLAGLSTYEVADTFQGKTVVPLDNFKERFVRSLDLQVIILPVFVHMNHYERLSPSIALKLLAPNSLREIFGGTPKNFMRLAQLTRKVPTYRLALSEDLEKNYQQLVKIVSELK
jgi:hypothetical protein